MTGNTSPGETGRRGGQGRRKQMLELRSPRGFLSSEDGLVGCCRCGAGHAVGVFELCVEDD